MDRCTAQAGHLVIFDRTERRRWHDRIFRREERTDGGPTVTVWACDPGTDRQRAKRPGRWFEARKEVWRH